VLSGASSLVKKWRSEQMAVPISNDFLSPLGFASCLFGSNDRDVRFETALKELIQVDSIYPTNSGTHALKIIFTALKKVSSKRFVAVAAYSCPDIAVAAILAGFEVYSLEINAKTLEADFSNDLPLDDFAAVVLSNLYGIPDNLQQWRHSIQGDVLIIDDACQSFLSSRNGKPVGTDAGTIGVVSFARGKPLAGSGGGAIVCNKEDTRGTFVFEVISEIEQRYNSLNSRSSPVSPICRSLFNWFVTQPVVSDLLFRLPIDLGKPGCREKISNALPSNFELSYASLQMARHGYIRETFLNNSSLWNQHLSSSKIVEPLIEKDLNFKGETVPIRYPVILDSDSNRDTIIERLRKIGIGATSGYRKTIQQWSRPGSQISNKKGTPIADRVSEKVILLPTNSLLKKSHIEKASAIFNEF